MNLKRDPWDILGVHRSADSATVKKAYKTLAAKYHPDRNQGNAQAEENFKEVNAAFEIMSDTKKLQEYLNSKNGFRGGFYNDPEVNPFQQRPRQRPPKPRTRRKGEDIHLTRSITLEELFKGTTVQVSYLKRVLCDACDGHGTKDKRDPPKCHVCNGHGTIIQQNGPWLVEDVCPVCHGSGEINENRCSQCHGSRFVNKNKTLNINIPSGLKISSDGQYTIERHRIANAGHDGEPGTFNGSLFLTIAVDKHPIFELRGADIWSTIEIDPVESIIGSTKTVRTIDGEISIKVYGGVDTGAILKIPGKGMIVRSGNGTESTRGDAFYTVKVKTIKDITPEQRELLERFTDIQKQKISQ